MFVHGFRLGGGEANEVCDFVAELQRVDAFGQVCRHRRENVARMKCLAHRLQEIVFARHVPHREPLLALVNQRKHAVVGRHEVMALAGHDQGPPRRPHARIDDHHVDGPAGKVRIRLRDGQRAVQHIKCLHGMADINNLGLGLDGENDALHGAHKVIGQSEVGGQRDDGFSRHSCLEAAANERLEFTLKN